MPGRLRRRLTVAFVLVAAVAAGALGSGSYLLVRQARLTDSLQRAAADARFQLLLSQQFVPVATKREEMFASFENTGHHVVLVDNGVRAASDSSFDPPIPGALSARADAGQVGYQRVEDDGHRLLLVGGRIPKSTAHLYLVSSEDRVADDLAQLRNVLLAGWGAVVALAALIGHALARRTLEPVGRASAAARSVAEGLLATRLPAGKGDEFGAWAASFNQMAAALEAKVTALSEAQVRERRFTSDVAHELRTPVTALVAAASMLGEALDPLPADTKRPAELLVADVMRLRRLVDELMEISRFDAGREVVRDENVSLPPLIEAIVASRGWQDTVQVVALSRGVASPDEITLVSDPRRLERIIANLVSNAVEHGDGEVTVTAERIGVTVRVVVGDRGPGIPAEHIPRLFDRFYKADPARAGGGSGLGLAIVRENALLLGGEVHVVSEVGQGTEFRITLPVTRPLHSSEVAAAERAEAQQRLIREGGAS